MTPDPGYTKIGPYAVKVSSVASPTSSSQCVSQYQGPYKQLRRADLQHRVENEEMKILHYVTRGYVS